MGSCALTVEPCGDPNCGPCTTTARGFTQPSEWDAISARRRRLDRQKKRSSRVEERIDVDGRAVIGTGTRDVLFDHDKTPR